MSDRVYIFLDESGNFDFSHKGTRYFVLTCVSIRRPFDWFDSLDRLKYDCIEYGLEIEGFHCSADNSHIRGKVFDIIYDHLDALSIDSVIIEKCKTAPPIRAAERFYPEMLGHLLQYVFDSPSNKSIDEVIVVTDSIPLNKKRTAVEKAVKLTLAKMLPRGRKYRIMHHRSHSHYGLQIADYCCWAIFRKYESGEPYHLDRIYRSVRSELDLFRIGEGGTIIE